MKTSAEIKFCLFFVKRSLFRIYDLLIILFTSFYINKLSSETINITYNFVWQTFFKYLFSGLCIAALFFLYYFAQTLNNDIEQLSTTSDFNTTLDYNLYNGSYKYKIGWSLLSVLGFGVIYIFLLVKF